uniref:Putative DNA binding, helix-turn-helix domain containing protein n=1 Tax=viral metagenome TaxID=1070528 RepID=A0A6M3XU60_9ZZZZ
MPRRRDAQRRSELHAQMRLSGAHRLLDLVLMACASAEGVVEVTQEVLMTRTGYSRRHVYSLRQELVRLGLWTDNRSPDGMVGYQMADGNPSAQELPSKHTLDDVFELQVDHAREFGYPEPTQAAEGAIAGRALEALEAFGPERCQHAHIGHRLRCQAWAGGSKYASFHFCYPRDSDGRLERTWFQDMIQQGAVVAGQRSALEDRRNRQAEEAKAQEARCQEAVTPESRASAKAKAREICEQLKRDFGSSLVLRVVPGAVQCASSGPGAGPVAANATAGSKTSGDEP